MNKKILFLKRLTFLFFFMSFCFPQTSFAVRAHEEADRRIKELNESLKTVGYFGVEKVVSLPKEKRPLRGFIAKWGFGKEGERVLDFIDILEKNKKFKECTRCLNALNEVFYLQFRQCLVEREVDPTAAMQLGIENAGVPNREKRLSLATTPGDYAKSKMLEILFNLYSCQSERADGFFYSYDEPVLASIMTKIAINILRARSQTSWSYDKKKDFIAQKIDRYKREFIVAFGELSKDGKTIAGAPSLQQVTGLIDILKNIMVERVKPFPWGKVIKWTVIGGVVVGLIVGGVYIAKKLHDITSDFGKNASEGLKEGLQHAGEVGASTIAVQLEALRTEGVPITMDEDTRRALLGVAADIRAASANLRAAGEAGFDVRINLPDEVLSFLASAERAWLRDAPEGEVTFGRAFTQCLIGANRSWFTPPPEGQRGFGDSITDLFDQLSGSLRRQAAQNGPGAYERFADQLTNTLRAYNERQDANRQEQDNPGGFGRLIDELATAMHNYNNPAQRAQQNPQEDDNTEEEVYNEEGSAPVQPGFLTRVGNRIAQTRPVRWVLGNTRFGQEKVLEGVRDEVKKKLPGFPVEYIVIKEDDSQDVLDSDECSEFEVSDSD